jgi:endonuclease YncB( thermonuclease family)
VKFVRTISLFILYFILYSCVSEDVSERREERIIYRLFIEVVDGDTVVYKGMYMRFLGVDTPEIRNPEHGFYSDQPYGREAKNFTRMEIKRAKRVSYRADGYDRYGRLLVHIFVDGYPLSLRIVEARYGYETVSFYGDNGFPDIARKIAEASKLAGELPFENPYIWRRKNKRN